VTRRVPALLLAAAIILAAALPVDARAGALDSGIAHYRRGRLAMAEAAFRQAVRAQPGSHQARHWLGVTLYARRRYADAAVVMQSLTVMRPRDPQGWLWWGHALAQVGDTTRARAALAQVLLLRPSRPVAELAQMGLRSLAAPARTAALPRAPTVLASLDPVTYEQVARSFNPRLAPAEARAIAAAILGFGRQYNVDPRLIASLIAVESGFSPTARSYKGAMGLGQLMPATAASLGVQAYDPIQNIYGTVRVMRGNLDHFDWDLNLALAAYNAGKGAVARYGGIPPYTETQLYVRSVGKLYLRMRDLYPAGEPTAGLPGPALAGGPAEGASSKGLASATPGQGH